MARSAYSAALHPGYRFGVGAGFAGGVAVLHGEVGFGVGFRVGFRLLAMTSACHCEQQRGNPVFVGCAMRTDHRKSVRMAHPTELVLTRFSSLRAVMKQFVHV